MSWRKQPESERSERALTTGWRPLVCLPSGARGAAGGDLPSSIGSPEGAGPQCQGSGVARQRHIGRTCRDTLEGGEDMERLAEYKRRYWEAMNASRSRRDFLLAEIMTDMEIEFKIPFLRCFAEREVDDQVLAFYRLVSDSRSI